MLLLDGWQSEFWFEVKFFCSATTEDSGTIEQSEEAVEEPAEEEQAEKEAEPAVEAAKPCALFASKSRLNTLVCSSLADFS